VNIRQAAAALRGRRISSLELTRDCLGRIAALNPVLNAFVTVAEEPALDDARRADEELARGASRGPLHGIPIALKDVFCTRGIRTTCGSSLFSDYVPDYDSAVAEKFRAAGAVLLGKTGLHELAYGITSNNPHFGTIRNPWDRERLPGGSSGGSGSAVAADMVFMAMGTDTGGSIRIPASFCGTVGLKPTYGRVSRYGVLPLDFSLDHMGPLTRTVRDAAAALKAIAGYDPRDDTSSREAVGNYELGETPSLAGVVVGLPDNFYLERVDAAVEKAVKDMARVAQDQGARVTPVRVPDIAALNAVGRVILLAEASAVMARFMDNRPKFGADVLALLDQGRLIPATDYINAQRVRRVLRADFAKVFRQVNCLFTPTTPSPAPLISQTTLNFDGQPEDVRLASTRFVRGINVLGYPALSIPSGFSPEGLPLSLQIVGRPFDESLILRVGAALENATEHHKRRPAIQTG
jgi:aspartyl-tRNA(Asn)/glutamyl-tRNA(Gln) amidotransferase subunit A